MPLFDAYIFVDWSAARTKGPRAAAPNQVWVGEFVLGENVRNQSYHRTRYSGFQHVAELLKSHVEECRRVLVGFDFPYGYPIGFAEALRAAFGLPNSQPPWRTVWEQTTQRIEDNVNNMNNRFEVANELNSGINPNQYGPFWGRPRSYELANLPRTAPNYPFPCTGNVQIQRYRIVEDRLPGVQETWRLYGHGSVGSQALTGIPYVHRLRFHDELKNFSRVWPFESGFTATSFPKKGPYILHAEIWPGVVGGRVQRLLRQNPDLIRDQAQVRAMCEWVAELDQENKLGHLFDRPNGLCDNQVHACVSDEGWILGAV